MLEIHLEDIKENYIEETESGEYSNSKKKRK
jgi:hypothetical protein